MSAGQHTERFAPSPTGLLHLGHAYSAMLCHDRAREVDGAFLLRMEDLDTSRVRAEYHDAIEEDLNWLGITWDGAVLRQSERTGAYEDALTKLSARGLTYPCTCSRRDISEAVRAPNEGEPVFGPDGIVYPGTCRDGTADGDAPAAIRLNMAAAIDTTGGDPGLRCLAVTETGETGHPAMIDSDTLLNGTGDIVLRRRDGAAAYHLAVVVDDDFQGATHVTRGTDLAPAVPVQRLLQHLLGLRAPVYHHHRLIRDEAGKRLAKRHDALSIRELRRQGVTPEQIRARLGL
ncbi:MAG: tRNA glutamyl-Q(34) synthetase GluQRS [Pseudomonadota bacterium]